MPSVGQGFAIIAFRNVCIVDVRFAIPGPPFARFPTGVPQLDDGDRADAPFQSDEGHDPFGLLKEIARKNPLGTLGSGAFVIADGVRRLVCG